MKKWIKFFAGISFILFPGVIAAQDNFSKDLAALVKDTIYEFHNLQGKNIEDSGYYSALHEIVGTKNGKVYSIYTNFYYYAEIIGSESEDSVFAGKILETWKSKLIGALGSSFSLEPGTVPIGFKAYFGKGYLFKHGRLSISLEHWKRFTQNKPIHFVRLFIVYRK